MSAINKLKSELIQELAQLRESEKQWRTLAESSPDHILSLANDLTILSVNHPAPGLTKEELIGNPITYFLPEDRQTEVKATLQGVIDTGKAALYETEHHTPDGEVIYYETHATQRLSDDRAEGLTLNSRDVTKRKQIEKESIHQGDLIKSIFLSAPIGIGMVTDRVILEANERLCEMIGYKKDELINQSARILYPTQADFDFVGEEKYEQIGEAGTGSVETRFLRKDGQIIDVLLSSTPLDLDDLRGGVTFSALDITERNRVREEINNSSLKWQNTFDAVSDAICILDPEQKITHTNQAMNEMFPDWAGNMVGQYCYQIIHQISEPIGDCPIRRMQSTLKRESIEIELGGRILEITVDPILDEIGKLTGAVHTARDMTEQVQAKLGLIDSEEKYRKLVNLAQEGIWVLNKESITTFVNPSMAKMLGYSPGEMEGKHLFSFMDKKGEEIAEDKLEHRSRGIGEQHDFEFIRKDNQRIIVTMETAPIKDKDGDYAGAIAGVIEITQRVEAEKALNENQRKLAILIGNLPGLAYRCNDDKQFTMKYVSDGCELLTGYCPEDLIDNSKIAFADIIHPDDIDMVRNKIRSALDDNVRFQLTYRINTADGFEKWVWEQGQGIIGEKNNVIAMEGFITDISEQKKVDNELAHSRDLMTYIIEHSRSSIAVHDRELKYIYVSKRYLEEYNVKDPNIIGKHHYDVFPDLPQKWKDVHQKALAGEISSGDNDPYYRDDGTVDWTRWECRPWYDEDDTIGGIIVYTEVITDQVRAGQEKDMLLAQVQEANERLRSLGRELINSQEAERKRISQELHDELGQALTAISLDLGIIEQNLHPETLPEVKDRLSNTKKNSDGLDQMIRELALDLRPSLLDDLGLLPTLNWYVERFSQRAEIEVIVEVIGGEKRVPEDVETALYRIIQEALTNVVKHAKAKKVDLRIEISPGEVIVEIKDDGRGFDSENLQFPGTPSHGLGLIGIADRTALVEGDFRLYSKPGEGTRIEVVIPL